MTGTDWLAWHSAYDDPGSDLSRRRRSIQRQLLGFLDRTPGAVRVVSACSGDGRDLLEVLARLPDAGRVSARLVELDARLARRAEAFADEHGLDGVEVHVADAGLADSYRGAVPADLVMLCGVFGNIAEDDLRTTIGALPAFCRSGGTVIWTRGSVDGDRSPAIRGWFADAGLTEVAFDGPADARYRVGVHRYDGPQEPLPRGTRLFTFTR